MPDFPGQIWLVKTTFLAGEDNLAASKLVTSGQLLLEE